MTYQSGFKAAIQKAAGVCEIAVGDVHYGHLRDEILALQPDETVSDELAASQAREMKLREALIKLRPTGCSCWTGSSIPHNDGCKVALADAALALPTDTTALREVCLRVAERAQENYHPSGWCLRPGEIVSEVLNENRI